MPFKKMTFSDNFISCRFFWVFKQYFKPVRENSLPIRVEMRGDGRYLAENANLIWDWVQGANYSKNIEEKGIGTAGKFGSCYLSNR